MYDITECKIIRKLIKIGMTSQASRHRRAKDNTFNRIPITR